MKPVVIRCPNCGTTQAALGECETCHEAQAGYYCPNHAPGRWIDGATCDACGARFGVETPPVTGPVSTPRAASGPVEWRAPGRTRAAGTPPVRPRRPDELDDPMRGAPGGAGETDPRLAELLEYVRRARGARTARPSDVEGPFTPVDPGAVARGVARGAIGCIVRLVVVFIVLVVLGYFALGMFFGGGYADLDDRHVAAASSSHAADRHALHVRAVPHSRQGRMALRAGAGGARTTGAPGVGTHAGGRDGGRAQVEDERLAREVGAYAARGAEGDPRREG